MLDFFLQRNRYGYKEEHYPQFPKWPQDARKVACRSSNMSYYLQCGWEIFRQKCNEPVLSWQMNLLACVFLNPSTTKCYLTIKAHKKKKTEAEYTRNWVPANQDQEMAATAQRTSRSCVIERGPSSVGCSMGCLPSALPSSPHIYTANGFVFSS